MTDLDLTRHDAAHDDAAAADAAHVDAVHDRGLAFDLTTMSRRKMLVAVGGAGAVVLTGAQVVRADRAGAATTTTSCATAIETETNGPYPADGTNTSSASGTTDVDVRTVSGIVRQDIRSSVGVANPATAPGVPLTFSLTVQDLACTPIAGAAVYVWHCDRGGNYSLYSSGITDQNYLRGIGVTDATGTVTFTSIVPGCYSGRWPHIHFEVYKTLADATSGTGQIVKTSQMALPENVADAVYATTGYSASVTNLSQITLSTDNVFGDDEAAHQLPTATGSVTAGYTTALTLSVDPTATETAASPPSGTGGASGTPTGAAPSGAPTGAPPSGAPTASPTSTATSTANPTATATASPSSTATSTATATAKPTATATAKPTATATARPTSTKTAQQKQQEEEERARAKRKEQEELLRRLQRLISSWFR